MAEQPEQPNRCYAIIENVLSLCGVKFTNFHSGYGGPSHTTMYHIRDGVEFGEKAQKGLKIGLDCCLKEAFESARRNGGQEKFLKEVEMLAKGCIASNDSESPTVRIGELVKLWEPVRGQIILEFPLERRDEIEKHLSQLCQSKCPEVRILGMKKGSLQLAIELPYRDAKELLLAFGEGSLQELGMSGVRWLEKDEAEFWTKGVPNPVVEVNKAAPDFEHRIAEFTRTEFRTIRILESVGYRFRALARLLSHFVYSFKLLLWLMPWSGLSSRGFNRFLSFQNVSVVAGLNSIRGKAELRRLLPNALLWWPLMVLILATIICSPLLVRQPISTLLVVVASGVLLWFFGGIPCGTTVSANGSYAAVPLAIGFAVAHSIASWVLGGPEDIGNYLVNSDPFTRVVGGVPGSSVVVLAQNHWALAAFALLITTGSILATALIMPGPQTRATSAGNQNEPVSDAAFGSGVFWGGMCGGGIGLIAGLTKAFGNSPIGFTLAFLLIGSAAFGGAGLLKTGKITYAAFLTVAHAIFSFVILTVCFKLSGTGAFLSGCVATGWLHATFFTLAYLVGAQIGGRKAGVLACALEGCGGFIGFAIAQVLPAPLRIPIAAWFVSGFLVATPLLLGPQRNRVVVVLGQCLPPIILATCAILFLVLPALGVQLDLWPRRLHQFGGLLLGAFLIAGVVLQATAYGRMTQRRRMTSIYTCFVRWWCITEVVPAVAALLLLCSGLRLIYETPGLSVTVPYVFYMLISFSFFFFDGLLFYRPQIARLKEAARLALEQNSDPIAFRKRIANAGRDLQLLLHFVSFPVVFWFGYARPNLPNPLQEVLLRCEEALLAFMPPAWARISVAVLLVAIVGIVLFLVRRRREK